jgi:hypothetical protein
MKRWQGVNAQYPMPDQIAWVEDVRLQFARQLYDDCLERRGADHRDTRLLYDYLSSFEKPGFDKPRMAGSVCAATAKAVLREMARAEQ